MLYESKPTRLLPACDRWSWFVVSKHRKNSDTILWVIWLCIIRKSETSRATQHRIGNICAKQVYWLSAWCVRNFAQQSRSTGNFSDVRLSLDRVHKLAIEAPNKGKQKTQTKLFTRWMICISKTKRGEEHIHQTNKTFAKCNLSRPYRTRSYVKMRWPWSMNCPSRFLWHQRNYKKLEETVLWRLIPNANTFN